MALLLVLGQTKGRKTITYGFLQALSQSFWSREITSFFTFLCLFHNFLAFRTDFLPNGNISTSYRLETHSLTEGRTQIEGVGKTKEGSKDRLGLFGFLCFGFRTPRPSLPFLQDPLFWLACGSLGADFPAIFSFCFFTCGRKSVLAALARGEGQRIKFDYFRVPNTSTICTRKKSDRRLIKVKCRNTSYW